MKEPVDLTKEKQSKSPEDSADVSGENSGRGDALMVRSVEKAFRVLGAFNSDQSTLSLSQIVSLTDLDMSAAQRFTHTLMKLGFLAKDPVTRQFELTAKTLDLGFHYVRANKLIDRAMPYLQHLSKETEETINLTVPDGTEIVFVSRFLSRHVLNTDVIIGTRMPCYCTAPGLAILSRLPENEAQAILDQTHFRSFNANTIIDPKVIMDDIRRFREDGYATAFEQVYHGDGSIASAITGPNGRPIAAINIAASLARYSREDIVSRFSPYVIAASRTISKA
ncbi:IclR family transcriptional regulator [Ochrobactrum quorumnocens]|jgi:IclR family pca regulon transcriptional regulator|nr:IclR family transcriptional regulator [[Ochrobactrum] quorumnocens]